MRDRGFCGGARPAFQRRTAQYCSLVRTGDVVLREDVVGATHRQSDAVLVVLEFVVGHIGVETLHQRHSSVAVVVDVVVCSKWWSRKDRWARVNSTRIFKWL